MFKIKDPCSEDWSSMTPEEKGKFCDKCSKTVHDFTEKSDQEIFDTIKDSVEQVCGHFRKSQINRSIVADNPVSKNKSIVLGALAVLGGIGAVAVPEANEPMMGKVAVVQQQYYIQGIVVDKYTQELLPFVNVVVYKGDSIHRGLLTNALGEFKIAVEESEIEQLRIEFSFVGYENQTYTPQNEALQDKFELIPEYIHETLGEVMLIGDDLLPPPPLSPTSCEFIKGDRIISDEYIDGDVIEVEGLVKEVEPVVFEEVIDEPVDVLVDLTMSEVTESHKSMYLMGFANSVYVDEAIKEDETKEDELDDQKQQQELAKMTVFPNPSTEVVNVNLPEEGKYILELFDLTGKRLFKETVRSSQYQFTVSDLAKGTYVLKVLNVSTMKVDSERLVVR